ncbi:MAG: fumarylacetoacetate hydrolase family protein [bacterium]|nr:fumarylacetoacetate hydrolase family protein [bacterium]
MKLVTMEIVEGGAARESIGVVLSGDRVLDLAGASSAIAPDMVAFLRMEEVGLALARALAKEAEGGGHAAHVRPLPAVRLLAPVPRPPKFIHAGRNFHKHLEESKSAMPKQIPVAPRFTCTIIGPDAPIIYPSFTKQLDSEAEIVMVIGKRCRNISREEAYDVIMGYTLYNDVTARDVQADEVRGGLFLSKNLPGMNAIGPWIVTADEAGDPQKMEIIGRVDGHELQRQSLSQMIFDIPHIISYLSQMGLEPGDLVSTGTPEGCAIFRPDAERYLLKVGSVAEVESGPLGVLRNPVVAESGA